MRSQDFEPCRTCYFPPAVSTSSLHQPFNSLFLIVYKRMKKLPSMERSHIPPNRIQENHWLKISPVSGNVILSQEGTLKNQRNHRKKSTKSSPCNSTKIPPCRPPSEEYISKDPKIIWGVESKIGETWENGRNLENPKIQKLEKKRETTSPISKNWRVRCNRD